MTNSEISDLFSLLAKLMDIHGENSFKSKSYANAAFTIDKLPVQLSDTASEQIAYIKGIGDSTAKKIHEILQTGALQQLNDLILKTPEGILQLLGIKGIGPKKIATIWHELGIESPGELLYACNENRLVNYKGFGDKTQQSIKEALEFFFSNQQRYLYAKAEPVALTLYSLFVSHFTQAKVFLAGQYARQEDIIDELLFVIAASAEQIKNILQSIEHITFDSEESHSLKYHFQKSLRIKIVLCTEESIGSSVFLHTSDEGFISFIEEKINSKIIDAAFTDELQIFEKANVKYIPPFLRHTENLTALADNFSTENIITEKDIKGVIHNHSVWSDGKNTIEEMAKACIERGYEYLVMSDHSVSSFYAQGLSTERIQLQQEEIERLNEKLAPFKIFKSIECDILNDGRLDYDDKVLATFDLVIASVHQNLKMSEEKAMERLLNAVANPYTTILGHPTGRLLLSRRGYPVQHERLIEACKQHNVAIEINANPRRLDIDWQWIQPAMKQGVLLSINPDAHNIKGIDDIRYGVISAQKGMLTPAMNVSSMSLREFESFIARKK